MTYFVVFFVLIDDIVKFILIDSTKLFNIDYIWSRVHMPYYTIHGSGNGVFP
jgi:hypothetical protein